MMGKRFLYLDTFATVRVVSDAALAEATRTYIANENFVLVIGSLNLMEIVSWPKRWSEVVSFVSSVPFCIAQNSDKIAAKEVANYPNEIASLPVGFSSSDHSFSSGDLANALSLHLKGKITEFERNFRNLNGETYRAILDKRELFQPEKEGKYSPVERQMFMQSSVLSMLFPEHQEFLRRALAAANAEGRREGIIIERFRSTYIQALAIFVEYYVQKKTGKLSDMGDILQLSLVPYVDLAVLDNERNNLIQRFNRDKLFPSYLNACNFRDFTTMIMK
ncbi:MAG TPA: hypothetical protein VH988_10845 [Thermoanaerobaculia bacterium]|jgi:hypothetical protein|nr:hypothetical protein [Thermoanaerobaculia bacterium]